MKTPILFAAAVLAATAGCRSAEPEPLPESLRNDNAPSRTEPAAPATQKTIDLTQATFTRVIQRCHQGVEIGLRDLSVAHGCI